MKVVRQSESELVLEDSSLWLAAVMTAAAVFLAYGAVSTGKKLTLLSAVLFLLFAFLSLRKTTVVFDSLRRMVTWQRLRYLASSIGSIPYDDIKDIVIEASSVNDSGRTSYRLAIATAQGSWAMSDSFESSADRYSTMQNQLRQFLNLTALPNAPGAQSATGGDANLEASLKTLVAQQQKIEAIKLLRSATGIDLAVAKQRVDEIEDHMGSGPLKS